MENKIAINFGIKCQFIDIVSTCSKDDYRLELLTLRFQHLGLD
jgi:hypothetical protein